MRLACLHLPPQPQPLPRPLPPQPQGHPAKRQNALRWIASGPVCEIRSYRDESWPLEPPITCGPSMKSFPFGTLASLPLHSNTGTSRIRRPEKTEGRCFEPIPLRKKSKILLIHSPHEACLLAFAFSASVLASALASALASPAPALA